MDTPYTFMTTRAKIGRKTKDEEQSWGDSGSIGGVVAEGLVLILNINTNLVSCLALQDLLIVHPTPIYYEDLEKLHPILCIPFLVLIGK